MKIHTLHLVTGQTIQVGAYSSHFFRVPIRISRTDEGDFLVDLEDGGQNARATSLLVFRHAIVSVELEFGKEASG